MGFKIVQTVEEKEIVLSIVPTKWESKGILNWPVKNSLMMERLLRDANSEPPAIGCLQMECKLKRSNIATYKMASSILSSMKTESDSEAGPEIPSSQSTQKRRFIYHELDTESYNSEMMMALSEQNPPTLSTRTELQINNIVDDNTTCISNHNSEYIPNLNMTQNQNEYISSKSMPEPIDYQPEMEMGCVIDLNYINLEEGESPVRLIPESFVEKLMLEFEKKIMSSVAQLETNLTDSFNRSLARIETKIESLISLKAFRPAETTADRIQNCKTAEEFIALESSLESNAAMEQFKIALKNINGQRAIDGTSACYNLIDHIVDRKVFLEFSWSGVGKGKMKHKLQNLHKIRNAIIDVVRVNNDDTFSDAACELFFSNILKNSIPRAQKEAHKQQRRSTKRTKKAKDINEIDTPGQENTAAYAGDFSAKPFPATLEMDRKKIRTCAAFKEY